MEIILSVEFIYLFIYLFIFPGMFVRLHCLCWTHLRPSFLCILTVILPFVLHGYETWSLSPRGRTWAKSFRKRGTEESILDFIGRGKICPNATLAATNPTWTGLGLNVWGIWGGENCSATGVSPSTWVLPCDNHSTSAPCSYLIHIPSTLCHLSSF